MFKKDDKSGLTMENLRLNAEGLSKLSADELAEIFSSIPNSVVSLDLNAGELSKVGTEELAKLVSSIPSSVVNIELSGTDKKTLDTIVEKMEDLGIDVNERNKPQGPKR